MKKEDYKHGIPYYSWREWGFGELPYWREYGDAEWLPPNERTTESVGIGALVEIAEKHHQELEVINEHVFTHDGVELAISPWGSRRIKLTEEFGELVVGKKEPWLTIFREFEEIVEPYARMRENIADNKNRRNSLSREKFVEALKEALPKKAKYHLYNRDYPDTVCTTRVFEGDIFGWEVAFLDIQDETALRRFFKDSSTYTSPKRMRVLSLEKESLKNYLCFEISGKLMPGNIWIDAHLVIDLRPTEEGELFFEASTETELSSGSAWTLMQKEYISSVTGEEGKDFDEVFEEVIKEILDLLGLSVTEVQNRGYSYLGKCQV